VLEYCCHRQFNPSVIVTNDWFTGLAAGYAKNGNFG
jgi:glycogen synthase